MSNISASNRANEALILTGEGVQRLDETRLANLTAFLNDLEITVTPVAHLDPTEPIEDVIGREDFRAHWGPGYGNTYSYFLKLAHSNDEIPLRVAEDNDTLIGDLAGATEWMTEHNPSISTTDILRRILGSRAEQKVQTQLATQRLE